MKRRITITVEEDDDTGFFSKAIQTKLERNENMSQLCGAKLLGFNVQYMDHYNNIRYVQNYYSHS